MGSVGHIKKLEFDLVSSHVDHLDLPPRGFLVLAHIPDLKGLHVDHGKLFPAEANVELTKKSRKRRDFKSTFSVRLITANFREISGSCVE